MPVHPPDDISGITPGDRSYLPHCIRSMRLLSDRCTQNVAPSASFHAQYHPRLGHPLIQQTPQDPCTALGRIRAVLSRSRKHRGFSRASGDVCCHTWLQPLASDHPCCVSASAVVHARKLPLAQYLRSLNSSPRLTWAFTRGLIRGCVVLHHDPAGRSFLGRRALGSSASRSPPPSSHTTGSPAPAAPAVSHPRFAAAAAAAAAAAIISARHHFSAAPRFSALSRRRGW